MERIIEGIIENMFNLWSVIAAGIAFGILLYAYKKERIDWTAIAGTGIVGFICLTAGGARWVFPLIVFFVVGHIASHYKRKIKQKLGVAQTMRTWLNVFANGGAAAIFALLYLIDSNPSYSHFYFLGLITAMAVATGDTFGTELGQVFCFRPISIITMKPVKVGTPGAVSKEGLMFSLLGSGIISGLLLLWGYSITIFAICVSSGFLGAFLDSILGSTIEKEEHKNTTHVINFVTTLTGGIIAMITITVLY